MGNYLNVLGPKHLVLLQLFKSFSPSSNVLLPALKALHTVHLVASSRCVDVPHRSKRCLYPSGHLSQQSLKVAHSLLVNHYPASVIIWVTVAEHENALHNGL